ncbi:hypothetical protein HYX00_01035 [Candidatus Woesearchaeota archaeon]|nr:hypothetical protein [Candidatus Woesearchaeota archaeon]
MAFGDIFSGSNLGIVGSVIAIFFVLFFLFKYLNRQSGRLGLARRSLDEAEQLERIDKKLIVDIKQEHNDADNLRDLFYKLNSRAHDLNFEVHGGRIRANFDFIVTGLDILSKGDKSVLNDKQKVRELFTAIDEYLSAFSDSKDTWVVEYIKQIRSSQRRLFTDIIEQDELLRKKFELLREDEGETAVEEGYRKAA